MALKSDHIEQNIQDMVDKRLKIIDNEVNF